MDPRDDLRHTFDSAAALYHRARPDYTPELFDDLILLAALEPGDRLLEVGCGTGKATLGLAGRGFLITTLELGADLADIARRNLAAFPHVKVLRTAFEEFHPTAAFDLVYAATAWHWIDREVGYRMAWRCLRPGGHLAFWSATHVFPDGGYRFFAEIQEVYDEIGGACRPERSGRARRTGGLARRDP